MRFSTWAFALAMFFVGGNTTSAQDLDNIALMTPTYKYSKQKTAYLTLTNGDEVVGNVKDFDRKRGVIDYIKIKKEDGKVLKLDAARIKSAYLHPTALSKFVSDLDDATDVQRWDKDLEQDRFKDGYVYLETITVQLSKKKRQKLLLELLNPHFSEGLKIYHDPFAAKSQGIGVGPLTPAGDNALSYYFLKMVAARRFA